MATRKMSATPKTRIARRKPHVYYHKDGTIWGKGRMADGVMTGYWEWYRKDGVKMRSGSFERGEKVGEWTTYDQQGKAFKVTVMMKPKKKA